MAEARRVSSPVRPGDDITALLLETMRQLAESAQLSALGTNVRLYRGAQGGTAIAVDAPPTYSTRRLLYIDSARTGSGIYKAYIVETFPAAIDTTAAVQAQGFGTTGGTEVTVVNFQEFDTASHWLTSGGNTQQHHFGDRLASLDEEGRPCYGINAAWFHVCE